MSFNIFMIRHGFQTVVPIKAATEMLAGAGTFVRSSISRHGRVWLGAGIDQTLRDQTKASARSCTGL